MTKVFNPPPHWPEPADPSWEPPVSWHPDAAWGPVPAGWRLWAAPGRLSQGTDTPPPLAESEDIPASGARAVMPGIEAHDYPVTVTMPGHWEEHETQAEDFGFGPAPERRDRPRLRLAMTLLVSLLGLLVAAGTVFVFLRLVRLAHEDLPAQAMATSITAPATPGDGPARA